ncbi:exopolyphosphatase [Maritimibacter sp. 55A14]|uniref:Ppx/GppA family phosphatase n=1 Tax=Maritimibacter sp. 55A14 TaxID=2174844 RepID=UPI000D6116E0|nr:Ppx/GppA family phosphatase [Maritimibacter sp. 55A14]PWE31300.1 exopolyphosphatase [Maritimibacter sp. 55A14]
MDGASDGHRGNGGGIFDKPLFEDPSARALSRVGVVDVGSNSVRLVVFDGAARSPAYFYNEKILCGLGTGLTQTGRLHAEGRVRALAALRRFAAVAEAMDIAPLTGVATAAVREAEDGPDFCAEVERETGLKLWVASGEEEARLSAQGVLLGWPGARGLVCDIGGGSMELAELSGGDTGRCLTSPLGPFRLEAVPGGKKGLKAYLKATMADLRARMDGEYGTLYLVGGSWRAIARLDMERRNYPLKVLHEYAMTPKSVRDVVKWIEKTDLDAARARTGTSAERMRLVPTAAQVLKVLVQTFKPKRIAISSYGIREGLLYGQMPERLRARDPLIEAARFAEATSARMPGFGKTLYRFLQPLYRNARPDRLRLVRAACLLHDTTWRAHPDYRAEVCFDNATRTNLGGLNHAERVFLGLALLHRYKNSRSESFDAVAGLLSPRVVQEAEVLGKAMRFGAMISVNRPEDMGQLRYYPKKKVLELVVNPASEDLFGEVVMARFASLAVALGCETKVSKRRVPPPRQA